LVDYPVHQSSNKSGIWSKLKWVILHHSHENPTVQNKIIKKEFIQWKGELEQVDDVCILGVKI
jgi:hypothetical protein